jgi:hypothetical protein
VTDETTPLDDADRIADHVATHPDAGVIEVLGELRLDPAEWRDVVAAALEADGPHAAVATGDPSAEFNQQTTRDTGDVLVNGENGDDGDQDTVPEGGSPDANPTPGARETGSSASERAENDESADPEPNRTDTTPSSTTPLGQSDTTGGRFLLLIHI